jgi:sulfite exporter TauE/SafE
VTVSLALAEFTLAFFGSLHCVAQCGGFAASPGHASTAATALRHAGRLGSYAVAGAALGALGGAPAAFLSSPALHALAFAAACLILFAAGLRIAGAQWRPVAARAAGHLGAKAAAIARRLDPGASTARNLLLGVLWGWAPCALVYAALPLALLGGSAVGGAGVMLAFGVGTLPALLGAGWTLQRLAGRWRLAAGLGIAGLALIALVMGLALGPDALPRWLCIAEG